VQVSRLPAALAYGLIRRGCSPANLASARYAMAAWRARPAADGGRLAQQTKASGPGDQARPRGLKPRAAAAAAARCVPSRRRCSRCPVRPLPQAAIKQLPRIDQIRIRYVIL
jgi:hypothetical protein